MKEVQGLKDTCPVENAPPWLVKKLCECLGVPAPQAKSEDGLGGPKLALLIFGRLS